MKYIDKCMYFDLQYLIPLTRISLRFNIYRSFADFRRGKEFYAE